MYLGLMHKILHINGTLFVVIMYKYYITIYEINMYTHMRISVIHKAKYANKRRQTLISAFAPYLAFGRNFFHSKRKSTKMSKISCAYPV